MNNFYFSNNNIKTIDDNIEFRNSNISEIEKPQASFNRNNKFTKEMKEKSILSPLVQEVSKNIYPAISAWFEVFQSEEFRLDNDMDKK